MNKLWRQEQINLEANYLLGRTAGEWKCKKERKTLGKVKSDGTISSEKVCKLGFINQNRENEKVNYFKLKNFQSNFYAMKFFMKAFTAFFYAKLFSQWKSVTNLRNESTMKRFCFSKKEKYNRHEKSLTEREY